MSSKATTEPVPLILAPKDVQDLIRANQTKDSSSLRILDATWFMPNVQRNAQKEQPKQDSSFAAEPDENA